MARIRFYTRSGCTLCEKIWPTLRGHCDALSLSLESVDIDGDAKLRALHGDWVPVVAIDGRPRLRGVIAPALLARELRLAAAQGAPAQVAMRVGVAIVFDRQGRMLVNKRPEDSYFGGWWEWPGGKCEMGETPLAAAQRELKEEIGIVADGWELLRRQTSDYPGRRVKLFYFRANLVDGSVPHRTALEHQWLSPREVQKLHFLEANLPILCTLAD